MVSGAQDPLGAADLGPFGEHSRRDRRLGYDPARPRQDGARHPAAARDQGRRRRLYRRPPYRLRLEEPVREAEERHQHRALSAAAWQTGGGRRHHSSAGIGQDAARDRQERPRRVLYRRDRRRHGGDAPRHRRPAHAGRFRRAFDRNDVADRHDVQGARRLAVPAEWPGHHHAGDAEYPLPLRPDEICAAQHRTLPSRGGSRAHRLHDARAVYRRSRSRFMSTSPASSRRNLPRSTSRTSRWTGCSICRTLHRR